jgi:hypothetical protein
MKANYKKESFEPKPVDSTELDTKYGYELYTQGESKVGWLLNIQQVTFFIIVEYHFRR